MYPALARFRSTNFGWSPVTHAGGMSDPPRDPGDIEVIKPPRERRPCYDIPGTWYLMYTFDMIRGATGIDKRAVDDLVKEASVSTARAKHLRKNNERESLGHN